MAAITSRTNSDGSVTVYADGVERVTHPAGSELANISKQFEAKPTPATSSTSSTSPTSSSSSSSSSSKPTIYRDSAGNIYDENKKLLNGNEFTEYTKNGAVEGGLINEPTSVNYTGSVFNKADQELNTATDKAYDKLVSMGVYTPNVKMSVEAFKEGLRENLKDGISQGSLNNVSVGSYSFDLTNVFSDDVKKELSTIFPKSETDGMTKVNSMEEFENLQKQGLTEADIKRVNGDIYITPAFSDKLKKTEETKEITDKENAEKLAEKEAEEARARLEQSYSVIDNAVANGQISQATGQLYKTVVANYQGTKVNFDEIITELDKIKEEIISPEYEQIINENKQDLLASKNYLEKQRGLALESEQATQKQELESTQGALEEQGLTFSGLAGETLGEKSALAQTGTGNQLGEGTLGAYQRRISSSSQAEYLKNLRNLTRKSEDYLGSDTTSSLGLTEGLVGGQQGSIAKNKETDIANTLNSLFSNREKAQNLGSSQLNQ